MVFSFRQRMAICDTGRAVASVTELTQTWTANTQEKPTAKNIQYGKTIYKQIWELKTRYNPIQIKHNRTDVGIIDYNIVCILLHV